MKLIVSALLALAASFGASATIIDFNSFAHDSGSGWHGSVNVGPTIIAGDFQIETCYGRCGVSNLVVFGKYDVFQADYGNAAVFAPYTDLPISVSRIDGLTFDFYSIDFSPTGGWGVSNEFTFNYADGTTESLLGVGPDTVETGLETFVLDRRGVTSVFILGHTIGGIGQFDNIVLNERPVSVPEPGTMVLFMFGLVLLASASIRRGKQRGFIALA